MALDVALGSSSSRVRQARIPKDVAHATRGRQAYCTVAPLSPPPRLWGLITEQVVGALGRALAEGPPSASGLQRAVGVGAQALARLQGGLIEPNLSLDAQLVCVAYDHAAVHVAISSGMRVYRARNGEPQRLLGRAQRSPGISHGDSWSPTERLMPRDLFVFGSRDAFGMRSIGAIAALLAQDPGAAVHDLCDAALEPCRSAGIGAALVVIRVT